jgi:hypothetical protein
MHLRDKEEPEPYCKVRTLRQLCRSVLFLIMEQRPADPITMAVVRALTLTRRVLLASCSALASSGSRATTLKGS